MQAVDAAGTRAFSVSGPSQVADSANPSGRYFITFVEAGLVRYDGSIAGLARTAPGMDGVRTNASPKLQINSAEARAYRAYLAQQRVQHVTAIENALGHPLAIRFTFDVTRHAVSAALTPVEAEQVAKLPGVAAVTPVGVQYPDTFRGPNFIGADKIWDGTAVPSYSSATRGAGVKVGIIDTGTNTAHPSFANDPACGFSAGNPKLYSRDCTSDVDGVCDGPDGNADTSSHGVHTGSTAAGNTIDNSANPAPLLPDGVSMSGVAPCATVYSYRVADHSDGALYGDYLEAAFANSIIDQVDVVNYSIGPSCGGGNPWNNLAFLDMEAADIFVAASAGNTRANCTDPTGLVANTGPWLLTVAASTQDQIIAPQLTVTAPAPVNPLLVGIPLNPGSTTLAPGDTTSFNGAPLRTYPANIEACTSTGGIPANTFAANEVAIVRRGNCTFEEKITNAYNAGARFVVVANNQAGTINMDTSGAPTDVAAFSIVQASGDPLIAHVNAHEPPVSNPDLIFANGFESVDYAIGDYQRAAISSRQGDVLADFSFRGPTQAPYDNLTKPDITGPGVDIFAALSAADGSYGLMSGTSMSSPHLAGSAALVRAVHPSWSPMEVKSALMTTTVAAGFQEDGVTPWTIEQVGSGRVDLSKATLAGLTMDETVERFAAANPSGGSINQKELNLPSLRDVACGSSCSWTRTFKNRLNATGTWTIAITSPAGYTVTASQASFTLAPGYTKSITFTATAVGAPTTTLSYGDIVLSEGAARSPDQRLTLAIKGETPAPEPGFCEGGACNLQVDTMTSSYSALGCGTQSAACTPMLWLNQFSVPAAEFPITLNTVRTIFSTTGTAVGDVFDVYVFQDNDQDPTNGATLVTSVLNQTVPNPQNSWKDVTIPGGAVLNGPGDVLIALVNRTPTSQYPASWDTGAFVGKSWLANELAPASGSPVDLSTLDLILNSDIAPGLTPHNYIIRGIGTNGGGRPITLDPVSE